MVLSSRRRVTVSGEFRDYAGAGVAAIEAELVFDSHAAANFSARTHKQGKFRFLALPPGTFTLKLLVSGAQQLTVNPIQIASGEQSVLPPLPLEFVPPCGFPQIVDHLRFISTERTLGLIKRKSGG